MISTILLHAAALLDAKRGPIRVDMALHDKLEKDLRAMTKLYKSAPTEDTPEAVKQYLYLKGLFDTFRKNLEGMVSEQIIGQIKEAHRKEWAAEALQKETRRFTTDIRGLFPDHFRGDAIAPAPWLLKQVRDANIRRYQKTARLFFAALKDFIDWADRVSVAPDREDTAEHTSVAGVPVLIHRRDEQDFVRSDLAVFFSHLHDAVSKIKRAGFESALEGLIINLRLAGKKGSDAAGDYRHGDTDELNIYPWGLDDPSVLIHEIGHRFYYRRLTAKSRKHWDDMIKGKRSSTTPESVRQWVDEVVRPLFAKNPGFTPADAVVATERLVEDRDEVTQARYRHLAQNVGSVHREPEKVLESMLRHHSEDPVLVEHITNYGATKPEEAFAEAFKLYVDKGPSYLGPWTRQFFRDISESGGARLRASVSDVLLSAARLLRGA